MKIVPIPCLQDNYAYLIICENTGQAGVVDPSEAEPVQQEIKRQGVTLVAILNTHHHWDHTGGNRHLLEQYPTLKIYGHASDHGRIDGQTVMLRSGDTIPLGKLLGTFSHNPGHTTGAISYYFENAVFTGDTLFSAGCGRLFEGSPADMYHSLNRVIGIHPPETRVFFGHEYTLKNLQFAVTLEPGNRLLQERLKNVATLRQQGSITTPSTLAIEKSTNPFMRCESLEIQRAIANIEPGNDLSPAAIFRSLRELKDRF